MATRISLSSVGPVLVGTGLLAVSVAPVALIPSEAGLPQEAIDLAEIARCSSCGLRPRLLVQLGEGSGEGIIESEQVFLTHSSASGYAVHWIGGHSVLLFDEGGAFQRRVGRRGKGPGEIGYLGDSGVRFSGRYLVALDLAGPKFVLMDHEGRHVREYVVDLLPGTFRMLSDTTAVVGSMGLHPDLVGLPLHLLDFGPDLTVRHVDAAGRDFNMSRPAAGRVQLGSAAEPGVVWLRQGHRALEQWRVRTDARRVRIVAGWGELLRVDEPQNERGLPRVMTGSFLSDRWGRLWLASRVLKDPELTWEDIPPRTSDGERLIPSDELGLYYSSRVDVYDLQAARHLGFFVSDNAPLRLALVNGEVVSYHVEYQGKVPVVSLYEYAVSSDQREMR